MPENILPLKIAPAAFSALAAKVNELVAAVNASLRGLDVRSPLTLTVADANTALAIDIPTLAKLLGLGPLEDEGGGGGEGGGEDTTITSLTYDDGTIRITIDSGGVKLLHLSSNDYVQFTNTAGLVVHDASSGSDCTIAPSALTHSMSLQEIDVCDGGVGKHCLILRSATYV